MEMIKAKVGGGNIFLDKKIDPKNNSMLASLNIISLASSKNYEKYKDYTQ